MTLTIGQHLYHDRYQIKGHLGQGGMGTVYVAADKNFDDGLVAIKENLMAEGPFRKQFEREGNLLYRLKHANLPSVTNSFVDEATGYQYLVMEYVAGKNLKEILQRQRGPLPEAEVLGWIEKVMDAVEYMHNWFDTETGQSRPVLHRDIKPGNIILRADTGEIVLVDFGLVKHGSQMSTKSGARGITPGYSPLEQYEGGMGTTAQTDIYALGATLYTLLTAARPPAATNLASGTEELVPPRRINPHIRPNTARVIERAMKLRAADRFESVAAMRSALHTSTRSRGLFGQFPNRARSSARSSTPAHQSKPQSPSTVLRMMVSLFLFSIVGLLGLTLWNQSGTVNPADSTIAVKPVTQVAVGEPTLEISISPTSKPMPPPTTTIEQVTQQPAKPTRQIIPPTITLAPRTISEPVFTPKPVPPTKPLSTSKSAFQPTRRPPPPTRILSTPTYTPPPTFTPPRIVVPTTAPAVRSSSNTDIPRGNTSTLRLLRPSTGETGRQAEFCWTSATNFALKTGEGYELIFWKDGEDPNANGRGAVGAQTTVCATVQGSQIRSASLPLDTELNWAVRRVIMSPYQSKELLSETRRFRFNSDGGGGGCGAVICE